MYLQMTQDKWQICTEMVMCFTGLVLVRNGRNETNLTASLWVSAYKSKVGVI